MITLTVTPVGNIDYYRNRVVDDVQVVTRAVGWDSLIDIFDTKDSQFKKVKACDVSIYDHRLVEGATRYHILHFFSKD